MAHLPVTLASGLTGDVLPSAGKTFQHKAGEQRWLANVTSGKYNGTNWSVKQRISMCYNTTLFTSVRPKATHINQQQRLRSHSVHGPAAHTGPTGLSPQPRLPSQKSRKVVCSVNYLG